MKTVPKIGFVVAFATTLALAGTAQSVDDETAAVTTANNAFYAAETALDMAAMEKVWSHENYIAFAGPRSKEAMIGWAAIQPYLTRHLAGLGQFSLKPLDMHVHVNGNSAWALGREEVGAGSRLKDGTPISSVSVA